MESFGPIRVARIPKVFHSGFSLLPKFKMADSPKLTQRRNETTNETQNIRYF